MTMSGITKPKVGSSPPKARALGANAIVAMRFDCNEIGGIMSEVAAYGTAVTVEPLKPAVNSDQV